MMRWTVWMLGIFLAVSLRGQDELPQDPVQSFDIEPPLLIQETGKRERGTPDPSQEKELDPERIALALEKAKKSAAAGERLFKSGVIAKVDAENRSLKVIRLEADLAMAQLEVAKQTEASQQNRFDAGEIARSELETAQTAVATATDVAQVATAQRDRAELDAAILNLRRQKKLLVLGSGRKSEVSRAEEKVTALQHPKE